MKFPWTPRRFSPIRCGPWSTSSKPRGMAADWGAKVVGLGSMTGVIGGQGTYLAEHASIPVTTGNSLTIYAAYRTSIPLVPRPISICGTKPSR